CVQGQVTVRYVVDKNYRQSVVILISNVQQDSRCNHVKRYVFRSAEYAVSCNWVAVDRFNRDTNDSDIAGVRTISNAVGEEVESYEFGIRSITESTVNIQFDRTVLRLIDPF